MGRIKECLFKLGEKRGNKRLYFEGTRLENNGFADGAKIDLVFNEENRSIEIVLSEEGSRIVSRKKQRGRFIPAVDINNSELTAFFGDVETVHAIFDHGRIIVSIERDELASKERFDRLQYKLENGIPLEHGCACHGGGVLSHALHSGLKDAGVDSRMAFAVEIDPKYLEIAMNNNPVWDENSLAYELPMEKVDPARLPKVDVFEAGLPCVGASSNGRSAKKLKCPEEDPNAGSLFIPFLNIIQAVNPSIVLLENVPEYQRAVSMVVIRQVLEKWGYKVHETILNGNEMGALEDRNRMCMVAVTEGVDFDFSKLVPARSKEARVGEVLDDSIGLDDKRWQEFAHLRKKEARDIEAGKGWRLQLRTPDDEKVGTIGRGYSKVRGHEPRLPHPSGNGLMRQFTKEEHARLKTIPEFLVDGVVNTTAHEILGNSVIYTAFVAVGRLIGQALKGEGGSPEIAQSALIVAADELDDGFGQLALGF